MKSYLVSLAVGILVGVRHALLRVRSPAPPVIALMGLPGMLAGEQGVGMARAHWQSADPIAASATTPSTPLPGNRHAP